MVDMYALNLFGVLQTAFHSVNLHSPRFFFIKWIDSLLSNFLIDYLKFGGSKHFSCFDQMFQECLSQ